MRRQTAWDWKITADTFLGGVGAGLFTSTLFLHLAGFLETEVRLGLLLGPILAILGLLFLLVEIGNPTKLHLVFNNLTSSWMSIGALIQGVFIISSLGYVLPNFEYFAWLPLEGVTIGLAIGLVAGISGILLLLYHGFLFSHSKGVPLWNTPVIPPLFLFLGLFTGLATLLLLEYGIGANVIVLQNIAKITMLNLIIEGVILWSLFTTSTSQAYKRSIEELKSPAKFGIIAGVGVIIPLFFLSLIAWMEIIEAGILAGVLALIGGFYTRHLILQEGRYYPSRIPR
ncbi:hypothetical protein AKJ48_01150 [candidate division MSBL1 archaeon SCGC-AAA261O19]|uniref:Uncharacterized protein n=1 Tax=candidate division MSBL1 archaeon SCGC-AAA261O19 TaxID=1698277 RepID=A0A133VEL0_9EURY|nr:hypothetical protein AKJ48_01150 [candidate division MSBL1 archaeon SCGC-AAA261O19]